MLPQMSEFGNVLIHDKTIFDEEALDVEYHLDLEIRAKCTIEVSTFHFADEKLYHRQGKSPSESSRLRGTVDPAVVILSTKISHWISYSDPN